MSHDIAEILLKKAERVRLLKVFVDGALLILLHNGI